jgi:hypothetical protein
LVPSLIKLSKDEQQQQQLKENIGRLALRDADTIIAHEILENIKRN